MDINKLSWYGLAGVSLCTALAQAEPFIFQGQLNDQGAPATGMYDLEFVLYSVDTGGTQIGPTVLLDDQQVNQGNFLVEIDFGDVFDGSSRWIEVSVRNGDSTDGYTELAPRVKIGSTPQASYATKAGVADTLADPFWTQAPGVLIFGEDGATDTFLFNRTSVIEPTDLMVLQSSMNGLGGMTISSWTNGMPYYGYATGGFMRAKTYFDPISDAWVVNKNGDQLEINANNDVIITNNLIVGGTITSLSGPSTSTHYKSFTPDSIFSGFDSTRFFNSFAGAVVPQNSNQYLRANIDLPHGAVITSIRLEFADRTNTTDLRIELWKRNMVTLAYTTEVLATSSGSDVGNVQVMTIVPNPAIVIDNIGHSYYTLRGQSTSGLWPLVGNMGIRNILIEYTAP